MGNCYDRQEELTLSLHRDQDQLSISTNIDKNILNKYIKRTEIKFYNLDDLIDKENKEDFICPICFYVLNDPISCSDRKNCHSFCKECIDNYLIEKENCPTCKLDFEYKINDEIKNELDKLEFKCMFAKEGCLEIIPYQGYLYHINNCKFSNMKYECCVKKYNYNNKEFEKCGYSGTKEKVIKHFILCEFIEYRCLFCDEYIFKMNLKKHMKHKCKFGIIKYENGDKYIGGKNYNFKEGYGTLYYYDDYIYEGEFKNDIREG